MVIVLNNTRYLIPTWERERESERERKIRKRESESERERTNVRMEKFNKERGKIKKSFISTADFQKLFYKKEKSNIIKKRETRTTSISIYDYNYY